MLNYEWYWPSYDCLKVIEINSLFKNNDLLLHILRSIMFQSFLFAHCWEAIERTHHLVVVFLNFEFFPCKRDENASHIGEAQ